MIYQQISYSQAYLMSRLDKECFVSDWKQIDFENLLSNEAIIAIGCFSDDNLIGFIMASLILQEADIYRFATHPAYRRKGIALALFSYLSTEVKSRLISEIFLEVACDNVPAIQCYEKIGFDKVGIRHHYYTVNNKLVDAVVMKKNIL